VAFSGLSHKLGLLVCFLSVFKRLVAASTSKIPP